MPMAPAPGPADRSDEPEQLTLFDVGADMGKLRRERDDLAGRGGAPATVYAYGYDWQHFARWCAAAGRKPLPASAETVELYLVAHRERPLNTLERRLSGIAAAHRKAGHDTPVGPGARRVLRELRRERGNDARPRRALTVDELELLVGCCNHSAKGKRDRALLLLGFASGCRRSELVGLDLEDVRLDPRGVLVRLRRSKTDQGGEGRLLGIQPAKRKALCPVAAVREWIRARGREPGPLFPQCDGQRQVKPGTRLGGQALVTLLRDLAQACGVDGKLLGAHSLRAGCVTAAAEAGVPESLIMNRTGHKSLAMVHRYVRPVSVWRNNPLARVL